MCFSAGYLSTLKELTLYPEKGVPTLGTPERGKVSGILFFNKTPSLSPVLYSFPLLFAKNDKVLIFENISNLYFVIFVKDLSFNVSAD